jgi:hypothetical protein
MQPGLLYPRRSRFAPIIVKEQIPKLSVSILKAATQPVEDAVIAVRQASLDNRSA